MLALSVIDVTGQEIADELNRRSYAVLVPAEEPIPSHEPLPHIPPYTGPLVPPHEPPVMEEPVEPEIPIIPEVPIHVAPAKPKTWLWLAIGGLVMLMAAEGAEEEEESV